MRKVRATNPELINAVNFLKKQSKESNVGIWRDVAERLSKPRRNGVAINVSRLNRYTHKSETVIVPGKVLGTGQIGHPLTVGAFAFSAKARDKIEAAKGKCYSLDDLAKKDPKGSKVKIIG
ncbi:MAG TPA: 50S ribosomal protein L18e [Candidatus Bathyarchaeia archaeon]|nr:50S ribosomal protein L18e [Candidatus Bathyarchaeia archaeon]